MQQITAPLDTAFNLMTVAGQWTGCGYLAKWETGRSGNLEAAQHCTLGHCMFF